MCGRYVIISSPEAIRRLFGYVDQPNFPPRYNVAPTQPVPIVRLAEGQRRFALGALGSDPAVGEGSENLLARHQRARRIGARQTGLS
jgi:putative SOS response-associated peptidase YedK